MQACIAQVPLWGLRWSFDKAYQYDVTGAWMVADAMIPQITGGRKSRHSGRNAVRDVLVRKAQQVAIAEQVSERLINWTRWPGIWTPIPCDFCGGRPICHCGVYVDEHTGYDGCDGAGEYKHPLGTTLVADLLPAGKWDHCDWLDGPVIRSRWNPDWDALAVITDVMTQSGIWPEMHGWVDSM